MKVSENIFFCGTWKVIEVWNVLSVSKWKKFNFFGKLSLYVLPLWSLSGLLNGVALWAQVCAWLFACGNESQKSHSTNNYWSCSASRLNEEEQTEVSKQKNTIKYHQSNAQMLWLFRHTLSAKNIASHCIEGEMLFKLYEMLLFLSNMTSSGNMCTLQLYH